MKYHSLSEYKKNFGYLAFSKVSKKGWSPVFNIEIIYVNQTNTNRQ